MTRGKPLPVKIKDMTPDQLREYRRAAMDRHKARRMPQPLTSEQVQKPPPPPKPAPAQSTTHAPPVKPVTTSTALLKPPITIPALIEVDVTSAEKSIQKIEERCRALAESLNLKLDDVNPLEALWMICDMQREILKELKGIRTAVEKKGGTV